MDNPGFWCLLAVDLVVVDDMSSENIIHMHKNATWSVPGREPGSPCVCVSSVKTALPTEPPHAASSYSLASMASVYLFDGSGGVPTTTVEDDGLLVKPV